MTLASRVEELRALALAADDAAGHFPAMYAEVTARVERRCAEGGFEDPERMRRFVDVFAGHFTRAAADRDRAPVCWQASWDVAGDRRLLVVQHLLLGVNAHVNHDLPQAVVEVAGDGPLQAVRADFDAVNDVLAATQGDVLRRLGRVAGWTGVAARAGGDRAFRFSLTAARRQAWQAAERLRALPSEQRPAHLRELDRLVGVLAYLVTRPHPPLSWAVPVLRRLEDDDPRAVTRALLG